MKPTTEQQNIAKAHKENKILKVNACAGSGKTSTLTLVANADMRDSLYLAFNKAMADEAKTKFPDHVICKTTHSVAFGKQGIKIKHKLNRPKGKYVNVAGTPAEIVKFFKIADLTTETGEVTAKAIATLIKSTVARFESSADIEVETHHVPYRQVMERVEHAVDSETEQTSVDYLKNEVIEKVHRYAKMLWKERIDPHSPVLATHDTYLKMYQLSNPTLNYDVIYLDEAQDTTDCVLAILQNQDAEIVYVGDSRQAIYGWRGAVNAMEKVEAPERSLTQSFRYGQVIADYATAIIGGEMQIKGNSDIESEICTIDQDQEHAMLFRTNGALLMKAVQLIQDNRNVSVEIDTYDFIKMLDSADALINEDFNNVKHEKIVAYGDWDDLLDSAEDDAELKRVAKIVGTGQTKMYTGVLKNLKKKDECDILLTTAHKSKGRQFNNLIIAEDFTPLYDEDSGERNTITTEELNLLYVASTRAVNKLQPNSTIEGLYKEYWESEGE